MAEILKEGIKRRLEMKGLDYNEHVSQNVNKITERNKERYRKGCRTFQQQSKFFPSSGKPTYCKLGNCLSQM